MKSLFARKAKKSNETRKLRETGRQSFFLGGQSFTHVHSAALSTSPLIARWEGCQLSLKLLVNVDTDQGEGVRLQIYAGCDCFSMRRP